MGHSFAGFYCVNGSLPFLIHRNVHTKMLAVPIAPSCPIKGQLMLVCPLNGYLNLGEKCKQLH